MLRNDRLKYPNHLNHEIPTLIAEFNKVACQGRRLDWKVVMEGNFGNICGVKFTLVID